jgi:hypothetical protein
VKKESDVSINWEDYLQLFDEDTYPLTKNLDKGKYNDIVNEFFKGIIGDVTQESVKIGDKKITCDKYTLQFDLAETMEFGFKILDEMVEDEDAKEAIYEIIDKVSEKIIENKDYTYFDRTEEEFKEEIQKFKNDYEKMLDELDGKSIMERLTKEAGFDIGEIKDITKEAGINIKAHVFIDKNDNVRKNDFIIDIHDANTDSKIGLKYETVINSINKKIDFKGIDKSNSVNPIELSEEQLQELVEDIQKTIMSKFLTNPFLGQLMGQFTGGQIF